MLRRLLVSALFVGLAGCGGRPPGTRLSAEATPSDPRLEPCEVAGLEGELLGECGTLVVPELRASAEGASLRLPFMRLRAARPSGAPPIVVLGDGPGASNYGLRPPRALLAGHDLLVVGYRGVDGARTLDCPEMAESLAAIPALTRAWIDALGESAGACLERLRADGVQLEGYGVRDVAADVLAAMSVLGYERAHVLADGFGAVVAAELARAAPERVAGVALLSPLEASVSATAPSQTALSTWSTQCGNDPTCRARATSLRDALRETAGALPRRWMIYDVDAGRLRLATVFSLLSARAAAATAGAWLDARDGDVAGLAQLSWGVEVVLGSAYVWGEALAKTASALPAGDHARELVDAELPAGTPVAQLAAAALSSSGVTLAFAPREPPAWPSPPLVVWGELDPRRPAEVSGMVVAGAAASGDLWMSRGAELGDLLARHFAAAPVGPALAPLPVDFAVSPSLATMAKLALGALVLFPLAGATVILLLLRRLRRTLKREAHEVAAGGLPKSVS